MSKGSFIIAAMLAEFAILIQLRGVYDVDLFWQVKSGQLMLGCGRLLTTDAFSYTHAGEHVPSIGWLAQLIYAALFRLGSWRALLVLHSFLFSGAFGIAGFVARSQGVRPFSVCVGMALGFLTGFANGDLRPQSFGLFCLSILLSLGWSEGRWPQKLLLAVPVLVFWQNTHPSVVVGAVALVGLVVGRWADWLRGRGGQCLPWGISLLLTMALISQFATPDGIRILQVNGDNLRVARDWLGESEWQPPWAAVVPSSAAIPFWFALGVTLALLIVLRTRVRLGQWLTVLTVTPLALYAARFALFWGLAMVPIWADWVDSVELGTMFAWGDDHICARKSVAALTGAGCLVLLLPPALQRSIFDARIPREGVRCLRAALPGSARIFNFRQWGGPLILEGCPTWKVAIDGRLYVYKQLEEWKRYEDASSGKSSLEGIVRHHRPDAFFLHPGSQKPLVDALRRSRDWTLVYHDDHCVVFFKRNMHPG